MVGDPKKAIYKDFGVETSLGFMSLKALGAGMRGMAHGHFGLRLAHAARRHHVVQARPLHACA